MVATKTRELQDRITQLTAELETLRSQRTAAPETFIEEANGSQRESSTVGLATSQRGAQQTLLGDLLSGTLLRSTTSKMSNSGIEEAEPPLRLSSTFAGRREADSTAGQPLMDLALNAFVSVASFIKHVHPQLAEEGRRDAESVMGTILLWTERAAITSNSEAYRLAVSELQQVITSTTTAAYIPLKDDLLSHVLQRLELALAELRAKFREVRFMRNTIRYMCTCLDAMTNGSYDDVRVAGMKPKVETATSRPARDQRDGARLQDVVDMWPPKQFTEPDTDYAFVWNDELKMMENTFTVIRGILVETDDHDDTLNALLSVLEAYSDGRPIAPNEIPRSTHRSGQAADPAPEPAQPNKGSAALMQKFKGMKTHQMTLPPLFLRHQS